MSRKYLDVTSVEMSKLLRFLFNGVCLRAKIHSQRLWQSDLSVSSSQQHSRRCFGVLVADMKLRVDIPDSNMVHVSTMLSAVIVTTTLSGHNNAMS